ncbi:MAG: acyloxyacyl hydrolase [Rikenellaceae bacterium]|nr:acyloxyacyl hydrolase [Rikenellaceae bacterium]MCL2691947.1 acyloxyacyl hydrolase [Rikenellaceae bacterium]
MPKRIVLLHVAILSVITLPHTYVAEAQSVEAPARKVIHSLGIEVRSGFVIPRRELPMANYELWKPGGGVFSAHLRYSFRFCPHSVAGRIWNDTYQGIGVGRYEFFGRARGLRGVEYNFQQTSARGGILGTPLALYLFQGARLASFTSRLTLGYEWNFGVSGPWRPYDSENNPTQWAVGSRVNALISAGLHLDYSLSPRMSLIAGATVTHFSNGNTALPNAGLNLTGGRIGLVYDFIDAGRRCVDAETWRETQMPDFVRHMSYDIVVFGSQRKRVADAGEKGAGEKIQLPGLYNVLGISFMPMYNLSRIVRIGGALDGFYDSSANIRIADDRPVAEQRHAPPSNLSLDRPPVAKQLALGISARAEFAMPFFTVGLGLGTNMLHGGGDMESVYQMLTLKIALGGNVFAHVGYSLHNFRDPNFLMLGLGIRIN